ncbi:peptidoglycan-binding domain-containing protein [uncultured Litoreibacter sp.]|uniref:peptidoglycan-binding domain-containing protein n=1 Tax=uncultured Litoreibacter sp. TaxID=1392394 RepID=UPI00262817DA|nr:peptidoglycan-binding domain-containing protein [uncultured Litoreibacter sp.]
MTRTLTLAGALALLAGCQTTGGPDVTRFIKPSVIQPTDMTPPSSEPGVCWGHEPGPEVTEIVSQTILVQEAVHDDAGKEISPAIYRKVRAPKTINDGTGRWFERVCDAQATPALIETLQRALAARGHYRGDVTGVLDGSTRRAVRAYQRVQGLDSDVLSLSAAQQLGLIEIELDPEVVEG